MHSRGEASGEGAHRANEYWPETTRFYNDLNQFGPTSQPTLQAGTVIGQLDLPKGLHAGIKKGKTRMGTFVNTPTN